MTNKNVTATKKDLMKGTIIKDNLVGLSWEIIDPTTLEMKSGEVIVKLEEDKLSNFVIVSNPNLKVEKEVNSEPIEKDFMKISYGIIDGYLVNVKTAKPITEQGILRFDKILNVLQKNGFLLLAKNESNSYGYYKGKMYLYDIEKDKFKLLENNLDLAPFYSYFCKETKKFFIFGKTETGTYGDFRFAYYYVLDKKTKKFSKFSFPKTATTPYIIKDNGKEVILSIITTTDSGMCCSRTNIIFFVRLTKDVIEIINSFVIGKFKEYNSKYTQILIKGNKMVFFNENNIAFFDLKTFELINKYEINNHTQSALYGFYKIVNFTTTKTKSEVVFYSKEEDKYVSLVIKVSKNLGYVQSIT